MPGKMKVTIEGKDVEIDVPAGFMSEADVKQSYMPTVVFEDELKRRTASIVNKQREEIRQQLLQDDEFKAQASETWGLKQKEAELQKTAAETVERQRKEWEKTQLEPLNQKLTKTQGQAERLLRSKLAADILSAASEAGVAKALLKPVAPGQLPAIVNLVSSAFKYDEQTDSFYVVKADGEFAWASNPTQDHRFKDVSEFLKEWATDKGNAMFVEDTRQRGAGIASTSQSGRPGNIVITKAEARDVRKYAAAKDAAAKAGVELEIAE